MPGKYRTGSSRVFSFRLTVEEETQIQTSIDRRKRHASKRTRIMESIADFIHEAIEEKLRHEERSRRGKRTGENFPESP